MGNSVTTPEKLSDTTTSSGSSGNADTATTNNNNSDNENAIKPHDAPPPVANATNAAANTEGAAANSENSGQQSEQKERTLEDKKPEKKQKYDPVEQTKELVKQAAIRFGLSPEMITEVDALAQSATKGLVANMSMIEQVIQKAAPVEFAATKFRESVGMTVTQVDNSYGAQLSSPLVGAQQRGGAERSFHQNA